MSAFLVMTQKALKLLEEYEVKENGMMKYRIKKKALSAGADFDVFDAYGNQIGLIDQKVMNFVKTYDISINGQPCGTIKKKFPALTKDMNYDARGWKLDGDALGMNFKFIDRAKNVYAMVKKKLVAATDTYEIQVMNDDDELLVVMLTAILDEAFHSARS